MKTLKILQEESTNSQLLKVISNTVKDSLNRSSFFSRLQRLIQRLNIPITEEDMDLIKKARKIRNDMMHGREAQSMPLLEIKIISNAVSQIIKYKLEELVRQRGENK